MKNSDGVIAHVADTAHWVAVYRAMETERPDAIFRDPFARRLAGPDGEAIVDRMPQGRQMAWAMVVRTAILDEIIVEKIARDGVDLVVNLAAGLDARPWRLALPATLRWVDVDFPGMIAYKTGVLRDERPRCRYEAVSADLSDESSRPALFTRITAGAARVLIVSEGLLIYLSEAQVAALSRDLSALPGVRWWLMDLASPRMLAWMNGSWARQMTEESEGRARFQFAPAAGTGFFAEHGSWEEERYVSAMAASRRLKREMRFAWFWRLVILLYPARVRKKFERFSGYALLARP